MRPKKLIKFSEEYAGKVYLIYEFVPEGIAIFYKQMPEARFPSNDSNSFLNYKLETPLIDVIYSTVMEAEKAVLDHLGIVRLKWIEGPDRDASKVT